MKIQSNKNFIIPVQQTDIGQCDIVSRYITFFHFSVLYIKIRHTKAKIRKNSAIGFFSSQKFLIALCFPFLANMHTQYQKHNFHSHSGTILDQFETLFQTFLFRGDEYNHRGLDICPCTSARHRFVVAIPQHPLNKKYSNIIQVLF